MIKIGTFAPTREGFEGRLSTISIDCALALVPAEPSEAENAPDYRVMAGEGDGAFEVGAGWKRVGEKAGDFVAVMIDDPALPKPLRANLFKGNAGEHVLMWSRPPRRDTKD